MSFATGMKTIVVATDLTGQSEAALEYARKLAGGYGARIVLAHGTDPVDYAAVDSVPGRVLRGMTEEARTALEKLSGESLREGIHSHSEIRQGAVAEMLVTVAKQYEAGLIVIGTRGMQGAGGVIIPPEGYWRRVEAICRKYGILLISDEVICGFGRLGQWFGFQHYDVKPDLVSMAKGLSSGYLPISAVGVADHIVETLRAAGGDFVHGYTYSGHPTCAAVALKNIEIMERERLVERTAKDTGPYLAQALAGLADHPLVGETRSLGLIGAVEIVSAKGTNQRFGGKEGVAGPIVRDLCIKNGLMIRAIRDIVVMSPPLVISHGEIDQLIAIIRRSLDEAEPVLRELSHEASSRP